jgi:hypothetical protein
MRRRDMRQHGVILVTPEVEPLFDELRKLTSIFGRDIERRSSQPAKVRVRFERLKFELAKFFPSEEVEARIQRYPLPDLDPEYLRRWDLEHLQWKIGDLDQSIEACTVEGVDEAEPFFIRLRQRRREAARKGRRELQNAPAKAKAAHA